MKKICKVLLLIIINIIIISTISYADYNYEGEELRGYEQMKKILEVKKEKDKIEVPPYIENGYADDAIEFEDGYEEEINKYQDRFYERNNEIRGYIDKKNNIEYEKKKEQEEQIRLLNQLDIEYENKLTKYKKNKTLILIFSIISILILVVVLILLFVRKNKIILLIDAFVIIFYVIFIIYNIPRKPQKQIIDNNVNRIEINDKELSKETKKLLDLLSGKEVDNGLDDYVEKWEKENIDIYNKNEVDISRVINDYIIKCYYCVKRKANNKELYSEDIDVLLCFNDPFHNYDLEEHSKYYKISDIGKYKFKITNDLLSKESMQGIYDSLTEDDINDYKNGTFLDKLISNIGKSIKSKVDFDAYSIIPYGYFDIVRLDETPILKCKYWYLDKGKETIVNLPYDTTFKYELAKYVKKDVVEWRDAYIKKMQNDPTDESTIFAYYIDKDIALNGIFTTVKKDGLYNIKDLSCEIEDPNASIYSETKDKIINDEKNSNIDTIIERNYISNNINKIINKALIERFTRDDEFYTRSFLSKYGIEGMLPGSTIDSVNNLTITNINEESRRENKYLCKIHYLGNKKSDEYIILSLHWQDDKVDDIEYYIVPEDKMNLLYEEMYKLAFND